MQLLNFITFKFKNCIIEGIQLQFNTLIHSDSCKKGEFQCKREFECIPIGKRCDGSKDCWDNTDEEDCPKPGHKSTLIYSVYEQG